MRIAIYGKGGIGKSTISSNISATMGYDKKRVLQIGCDPKHDSTHILSNSTQPTLLDELMKNKELTLDDICITGKYNIKCIEIGGPSPGVGCAGRGIIRGLEIIKNFKIHDNNHFDNIIFDILGDVVCGGFFEPLKPHYVDEMYIVTSGEINSIFAANNLCKGYNNCKLHDKGIKLAGIIANCRKSEREKEIVINFAHKANLNIVEFLDYDERIERCMLHGKTIVEEHFNSDLHQKFKNICTYIERTDKPDKGPTPLDLSDLRRLTMHS